MRSDDTGILKSMVDDDVVLSRLKGLLDTPLTQLLRETLFLLEREQHEPKSKIVVDYGFLVFSAALVYEGFLKRWLYHMGLISTGHYKSEHFRIGKALNPDLPTRYRDEGWVYERVADYCGGNLADQLWRAWKQGRNEVFHYDVGEYRFITLAEAEERVAAFLDAMLAAAVCERKVKREEDGDS